MAKIVDPDDLKQGVEITITPGTSGTIKLNPGSGDLVDGDGVTLQCIYSFLKEEWKTDSTLIRYPFPIVAITEESMELQNGWNWEDADTIKNIRDGGWALKNSAGVSKAEYMNLTTLGSFDDSGVDNAYYVNTDPASAGTPIDFEYTGEVNEPVQIYGVTGYGHGEDRRGNFIAYLREEQKTYDSYDLLTEQNLSVLTYKKYALPLANADDIKAESTDAEIEASDDHHAIRISYYQVAQPRLIGSTYYDFHVIIDAHGSAKEDVYEKVQYLLRQTGNINSGETSAAYPIRGDVADELLTFVGDTLYTNLTDWGGVYIDNFALADINSLIFVDDDGDQQQFPYTATGNLLFNDYLVDDEDAYYWMFFTAVPSGNYGDSDAILVRDTNSVIISGAANSSSIEFSFDYDTNTQGGRDKDTPAHNGVTVVAIGLNTAQFVSTTSTLTRSTANNISLVAAQERNYSNP